MGLWISITHVKITKIFPNANRRNQAVNTYFRRLRERKIAVAETIRFLWE